MLNLTDHILFPEEETPSPHDYANDFDLNYSQQKLDKDKDEDTKE